MKRHLILVASALVHYACSAELEHQGPFDPMTDAAKQAPAEVSGKITLEGESDYAGVNILFSGPTEKSTVTLADGSFSTNGLVPGRYRITYSARGFQEISQVLELSLGERLELPTGGLALRTATVRGEIKSDDESLLDVTGSQIRIRRIYGPRASSQAGPALRRSAEVLDDDEDSFTDFTTVDSDGTYEYDGVKAGTYTMIVKQEGAVSTETEFNVSGETEDVTVKPQVIKPLSGVFSIRGTLRDGSVSLAYTVTRDVTVLATAYNASFVQLGEDRGNGCIYGIDQELEAAMDIRLSAGDGLKTACMRLKDNAGASSPDIRSTIFLDATPPTVPFLELNGGREYTTDDIVTAEVFASDTGAGVHRIHYRFGAATTSTINYVPSFIHGLTQEGEQDLWLQVEDRAGNLSLPYVIPLRYDGTPPISPAVEILGSEGVALRTAREIVTLQLSYPDDAAEMRLSNLADLSGVPWQAVTPSLPWQLYSGDGVKTVYVQVRDEAGNASAISAATITLDQSPPETPALQVFDIDGDGFALSSTRVELRWSQAIEGDLASYELQVFVEGLSTSFVAEATPGPSQFEYASDVSMTTGYTHNYRVRAADDLGNTSAWSNIAIAKPFDPVGVVCSVEAGPDQFSLGWSPGVGTYTIESTLSKRNAFGTATFTDLTANQVFAGYAAPFALPEQAMDYELILRQSNQDNSLSYRSTFDAPGPYRKRLGAGGLYVAIEMDLAGAIHIGHWDLYKNDLLYTTNKGGEWVTESVESAGRVGEYADMTLDAHGYAHFSYYDGYPNNDLKYATNASGSWQVYTVDATGTTGWQTSIAVDSQGAAHVSYHYQTENDLRYATNESGSWQSYTLDTAGNTGQYSSIVVDSDDRIHIGYLNVDQNRLYYATNKSGGWTRELIGPASIYTNMAVDGEGGLHIAYEYDSQIWYAENTTGTWTRQAVDPSVSVGRDPGIALDLQGRVFITYRDYGNDSLKLATNLSGGWENATLDASARSGQHSSIALDRAGRLHIAYSEDDGYLRYLNTAPGVYEKTIVHATGDAGEMSSYARAATGVEFIAYYQASGQNLRFASNVTGVWEHRLLDGDGEVGWFPSLAVDADGLPHVAYYKMSQALKYATATSSGVWSIEVVDDSADAGRGASLALDSTGAAHISYHDFDAKDLKYATNASGNWVITTLESSGNVGYFTSIAVDNQDNVYIAYQHPGYKELRYATNRGGSWSFTTIDSNGDAGWAPQLVLDENDTPHISYHVWPGETRYATLRGGGWQIESLNDLVGNTAIYSSIAVSGGRIGVAVESLDLGGLVFVEKGTGRWTAHVMDIEKGGAPSLEFVNFDAAYLSYYDRNARDLKYLSFHYQCSEAKQVERIGPFD